MTLCIAAVCQRDRRIVIATDWKAGTDEAAAENEDKLYWVTDSISVMIAGVISRAVELKDTYRQLFAWMNQQIPPVIATSDNISDMLKRGMANYRRKRADEYTHNKLALSHKAFLEAVGKSQVPRSVAVETFAEIAKLELECELIITFFDRDKNAFAYKVNDCGIELCNNFAAIGTGSTIAEATLYQRKQEARMRIATTVYNVFEAMELGSISPTVGAEHTINILRAPNTKSETVRSTMTEPTSDAYTVLEEAFKTFGPKKLKGLSLPRNPFEPSS